MPANGRLDSILLAFLRERRRRWQAKASARERARLVPVPEPCTTFEELLRVSRRLERRYGVPAVEPDVRSSLLRLQAGGLVRTSVGPGPGRRRRFEEVRCYDPAPQAFSDVSRLADVYDAARRARVALRFARCGQAGGFLVAARRAVAQAQRRAADVMEVRRVNIARARLRGLERAYAVRCAGGV